jgi:ferric-dicitrate binding protein FerR (iron transport regulator)
VKHVGTQYEVRTQADAVLVAVREGRVLVTSSTSSNTGEAGQVLRLSTEGELTRSMLAATDPHWQWTLQAAPEFDIENQSLASFLQWIARETGRHVVYSSPQAQTAAAGVKLRGSIEGLDADAALAAVLSTTQFRRYQTDASEIAIELPAIDSAD